MNPVIVSSVLLLAVSLTTCEIFRNEKDEYFYFNGKDVQLDFQGSKNLCHSVGGVLPDLSSNDKSFMHAWMTLVRGDIWLGVIRKSDGNYVAEDGKPVQDVPATLLDCGSTDCALVYGQKLMLRDVKRKAMQVCKMDKEALSKLREDLDIVSSEVSGLAIKENALQSEQKQLKEETSVIERKVESVIRKLNESGGPISDSPIIWHPTDTLRQLVDNQRDMQRSAAETKDQVSQLKGWKEVMEHNFDLLNAAVEEVPSLESRTRDVENQILSLVQDSLPHIEANFSLLDLTMNSFAQDLQNVKSETEKQVDHLKSYIEAHMVNLTESGEPTTTPEALEVVMNKLRTEMREKKEEVDSQMETMRKRQEGLDVKADQLEKGLLQVGEKMRYMLTEWKSALDRILQPPSATRRRIMKRIPLF